MKESVQILNHINLVFKRDRNVQPEAYFSWLTNEYLLLTLFASFNVIIFKFLKNSISKLIEFIIIECFLKTRIFKTIRYEKYSREHIIFNNVWKTNFFDNCQKG